MSRDQAYAEAGFKPHRQNAHRLMTKDDVKARVEELAGKASEKAEWSAAERLLTLKRITEASASKDARIAVSAISEANKMQGSHAATKHQHSGKLAIVTLTADKLKDLTTDELSILEQAYPVLEKLGLVGSDTGGEGEA